VTVYFVRSECGRIKIGFTDRPPEERLAGLQTGSPRKLELLGAFPGTIGDEHQIHAHLASSNALGEWFEPTPALFSLFHYMKEFGTIDGWEDACDDTAEWARYTRAFGSVLSFYELGSLPAYEIRWKLALDQAKDFGAIVDPGVTWDSIWASWSTNSYPAQPDSLFFDLVEPDHFNGEKAGFHCREFDEWRTSSGAQHTVGRLLANLKDEQGAAAVWIAASIRCAAGRHMSRLDELARRAPSVGDVYELARKRGGCAWHSMAELVLPEPLRLPQRCLLDTRELVIECIKHRALILSKHRMAVVRARKVA
jgi:hypothetical protein